MRHTEAAFQRSKPADPREENCYIAGQCSRSKCWSLRTHNNDSEQPDATLSDVYSKEFAFIIAKMLEKDARRRPSPDAILAYSAVQLRLERAAFKAREAELLRELDRLRCEAPRVSGSVANGALDVYQERGRHQAANSKRNGAENDGGLEACCTPYPDRREEKAPLQEDAQTKRVHGENEALKAEVLMHSTRGLGAGGRT